jgi:hypothetical protein
MGKRRAWHHSAHRPAVTSGCLLIFSAHLQRPGIVRCAGCAESANLHASERNMMRIRVCALVAVAVCAVILLSSIVSGQLTDKTLAPNTAGSGINKSLAEEIGAGRGDVLTHNSSNHQPRSIPLHSRGRQLSQKFTRLQGHGPLAGDGKGEINNFRHRGRSRG